MFNVWHIYNIYAISKNTPQKPIKTFGVLFFYTKKTFLCYRIVSYKLTTFQIFN